MSGLETEAETAAADDPRTANDGIGATIRRERSSRGLSIRELARRVHVSASFISQVELGKAAPSMGLMFAIASELGISLDSFMTTVTPNRSATPTAPAPAPGPPAWHPEVTPAAEGLPNVQRAGDRARVNLGNVLWERLTSTDIEGAEFLQITYPPGSESCPPNERQTHSGWELGVVLSGSLGVDVGFSSGTLEPGDSIYFSSTIPHRLSNSTDVDCTAIWIVLGRVNSRSGPSEHRS